MELDRTDWLVKQLLNKKKSQNCSSVLQEPMSLSVHFPEISRNEVLEMRLIEPNKRSISKTQVIKCNSLN